MGSTAFPALALFGGQQQWLCIARAVVLEPERHHAQSTTAGRQRLMKANTRVRSASSRSQASVSDPKRSLD